MTLFNAAESRHQKEQGMAKVESNNFSWTELARNIAIRLAKKTGDVCADDVHKYLMDNNLSLPDHPNAWGSIFRCKQLRWSGKLKESSKVSRHSGLQRIWVYVPLDQQK